MKKNRKIDIFGKTILTLMLGFFVVGFVLQTVYKYYPNNSLPIAEVTKTVQQNCDLADKKIDEIATKIKNPSTLKYSDFLSDANDPFTILIYKKNELVFWSNNNISPKNITDTVWNYQLLSNAHCLTKSFHTGEYNIVAYVPLKYQFPYENDNLQNVFLGGINLNKDTKIFFNKWKSLNKKTDVFSKNKDYLFSLKKTEKPLYNDTILFLSFFSFLFAFLLFFIFLATFPNLLKKGKLSIRNYFIVSFLVALFVIFCTFFDFPYAFFSNKIFSPKLYSSTKLNLLSHLSFVSFFFFAEALLFYFFVENKTSQKQWKQWLKNISFLLVPLVFFFFTFQFFTEIAINSTTKINIVSFEDFTWVDFWIYILSLLWSVGLMMTLFSAHKQTIKWIGYKKIIAIDTLLILGFLSVIYWVYREFWINGTLSLLAFYGVMAFLFFIKKEKKHSYVLGFWLFVFTFLLVVNYVEITKKKKFNKYKVLAENHFFNQYDEEDRVAESLFPELNREIEKDDNIPIILNGSNNLFSINTYISNHYLTKFWNKYEVRLFLVVENTELFDNYQDRIDEQGKKIGKTNFYKIKKENSDLVFLGKFSFKKLKGKYLFLEFYSKRKFKSYSFPNLLISSKPTTEMLLNLSSASYRYRQLKSQSGEYDYPKNTEWIQRKGQDFFTQKSNGYIHYIYVPNAYNCYVLSEKNYETLPYLVFSVFYTFLIYYLISLLIIWFYKNFINRKSTQTKFASKYLYSFIFLIIFGFIGILLFTVNYMENRYKEIQLENIHQTKKYIQSYLQENYFWVEKLDSTMLENINQDLQHLAYTYQTDIHIYNNEGELVSTSQPTLFSRNLISRKMASLPFFMPKENVNYSEKIGNLEYLTAYAEFYNGDFLQLGYIAIPFFLSKDSLNKDINQLLTAIIQIYIFIIVLLVLFSIIIAKRLSKPLTMIQENLKEMGLDKSNKKIRYKANDEIGKLVNQYNKTVEELQKSAQNLMKSERESAWRTMARQVAHEINNPLTPMKLTIQQVQRIKKIQPERFDEAFEKSSETLIEQIENLTRIATSFSHFAKMPETRLSKIDVAERLTSVVNLFDKNNENIVLTYKGKTSDVETLADGEQLVQVFNNIIKNAIQSITHNQKGKIEVELKEETEKIIIHIKDNGKGITNKNKARLFQPNFTTKSTGMGLGLSICKSYIEKIGGTISFTSELNKGTAFVIVIPKRKE